MGLRILYVGENDGTCIQRARALEELGHRIHFVHSGPPPSRFLRQVYRVGHHLSLPPDLLGAHRELRKAVDGERFDLLWVDKGRSLKPSLLRAMRERAPHMRMLSYSPDDMTRPYHSSIRYRASLPVFDAVVTTKSYIADDLRKLGARRVLFVGNAYDPAVHRPLDLSAADRERFACDVGFFGTTSASSEPSRKTAPSTSCGWPSRACRSRSAATAGVDSRVATPGSRSSRATWPRRTT
jgi:hypothetical protein